MRRKKGVILTEKLDAFFRERYALDVTEGEARGEANGEIKKGRSMVLTVLRARFKRVPKEIENAINRMNDSVALESWAALAATCQSVDEFAEALK